MIVVATLHLAFRMKDGSLHYLDVDLNIPIFTTSNSGVFEGDSLAYKQYLTKFKPIGWRELLEKVVQMSACDMAGEKGVRVRMVAKDTYIACQDISFNTSRALMGKKLQVYVLLKLLKFLVSADVKSYLLKWAVEQTLNTTILGEEISPFFKIRSVRGAQLSTLGSALKEVLKFHRIRNKFGGIKEELLDLGYGSIEVVEEGFKFISIEDTRINQITEELAKSSVGTFAYYLWKI